ncbi:MAG: hypothetical protein KatS3mg073_1508 [Meiothermus sp.]|nr:MAG: hypothetical protein KatS3mg073_1508 [Meiothermus sp.]
MDILAFNDFVNRAVYGEWMMLIFILVGFYLSFRTGFPQFSRLGIALRETFGAIRERFQSFGGQITPFQAAMVAMSATIGTGHLIGMVGAVLMGGPGAVLWMWVAYLVGMATKFAEAVLASISAASLPMVRSWGGPCSTFAMAWAGGLPGWLGYLPYLQP